MVELFNQVLGAYLAHIEPNKGEYRFHGLTDHKWSLDHFKFLEVDDCELKVYSEDGVAKVPLEEVSTVEVDDNLMLTIRMKDGALYNIAKRP